MSKKLAAAALAAMCVFCTNIALADGTSGYDEKQTGKDQTIEFKDADVLDARAMGEGDMRIRVMPQPKRVVLLRPRTQFVTELLKSVEAL